MADHQQIAMKDAHAALIAVNTRGDDQIHLIDFLSSVSEAATSSDDLLLRLREVCLPNVIAKETVTNNPTLFLAIRQLLTVYRCPSPSCHRFPNHPGRARCPLRWQSRNAQEVKRCSSELAFSGPTSLSTGGSSVFIDFGHYLQWPRHTHTLSKIS
jgi:hypothetical protein